MSTQVRQQQGNSLQPGKTTNNADQLAGLPSCTHELRQLRIQSSNKREQTRITPEDLPQWNC
jgi:hypothetical protein